MRGRALNVRVDRVGGMTCGGLPRVGGKWEEGGLFVGGKGGVE